MDELNQTKDVTTIGGDGFDTMTVIDMGDAISLAQVDDMGDLQDVIISHDQAERLVKVLAGILG